MDDVIRDWLESGQSISIDNVELLPLAADEPPGSPVAIKSNRAEVYFLRSSSGQFWVIKKFLSHDLAGSQNRFSIKTFIPRRPGFEAGYMRRRLEQTSIVSSAHRNSPLAAWIENSILMPAGPGIPWAAISLEILGGRQYLPKESRIHLVRSLSEKIRWLEAQDISHRDFSGSNVCIDLATTDVHVVGWDAMFHPDLLEPEALSRGTRGFIAPFLNVRGIADGRYTWVEQADRFSLALLNAEVLSIGESFSSTGDGGLCDQDEIYNRSGPCLDTMIAALKATCPKAAVLLEQALKAEDFARCPSPADWIGLFKAEPGVKTRPIAIRDRSSFFLLNSAGFTRLNQSAFVKLKRQVFAQPPYRMKTNERKIHR